MGNVGLLYVGAVLFINGAMLLGWVKGTSAAPLNLFVGLLQVVTPTYLIISANGDANQILGASGLYLFGFTYLYVACNLFFDLDGTGLGWFSAFVAVCTVVYAYLSFTSGDDPTFGVVWLYWGFLWGLFFVVLGLGWDHLSRFTGAVAAIQGWTTGFLPAFLLMTGNWDGANWGWAIAYIVFGVVVFGLLYPRLRETRTTTRASAPAAV